MYDPAVESFLSEDPVKGLPTLTQTMNPYSCSANNPLRYPDPSGMLGEGTMDDDPLMPSGGDSPHNARAQKLPEEATGTEGRENACPGQSKAVVHLWGVERFLDACETKALIREIDYILIATGAGGAAAGKLADTPSFSTRFPTIAKIFSRVFWPALAIGIVEGIERQRITGVDKGKGIIAQLDWWVFKDGVELDMTYPIQWKSQ